MANKHIKVAVVGRTGAGKTTCINSFANHYYGLGYYDERKIAITQNFELIDSSNNAKVKFKLECNFPEFMSKQTDIDSNQTNSQTQRSNIYTFSGNGPTLSLIDTPGIGDPRGLEQDKLNVKLIVNGVKKLGEFHGICLVHKSSDAKKDVMVKYLIDEMKGILTKDCKDNFIVCSTCVVNKNKLTL